MKRLLILIPACAMLVGCPGENTGVGSWRRYDIINSSLCFTVNKSDILSRYAISSMQNKRYTDLAFKNHVSLTYPDTCIKLPLTRGYFYQTSYTLNGSVYRYNFFIDNNGLITSTLTGGE